MDYPLTLAGVTSHRVVLRRTWRGMTLLVDGRPATRQGRKRYLIPTDDGGSETLELKPGFLSLDPKVIFRDETHELEEPLAWYEWVLVALPLLLVVGGAVGGALGVIAVFINHRIIRSKMSTPARIGTSLGVTVAATIAWIIIALIVEGAFS
jgi:hypothetical protein